MPHGVGVEIFFVEGFTFLAYIWLNYRNWLGSQPGSVQPPRTYISIVVPNVTSFSLDASGFIYKLLVYNL